MSSHEELSATTDLAPADAMGLVAHLLRGVRPNTIGQILAFDAQQNAAALRLVAVLDASRHQCRAARVRLALRSTVDESFHLAIAFPPLEDTNNGGRLRSRLCLRHHPLTGLPTSGAAPPASLRIGGNHTGSKSLTSLAGLIDRGGVVSLDLKVSCRNPNTPARLTEEGGRWFAPLADALVGSTPRKPRLRWSLNLQIGAKGAGSGRAMVAPLLE